MGNTVSTRRIEFETTSWPLDARPHLIVERRGWTLYYAAAFPEAEAAKRYVERVEPVSKRVGIERGQASWVGQALEMCNPGSGCLAQEKRAHPENFSRSPGAYPEADSLGPFGPRPQPGKSLGLLTPAEFLANGAAKNERTRVNYERVQAQERAWEIANGLRTA